MSHTDRHDPYAPRTQFEQNTPASPLASAVGLAVFVIVLFGAIALFSSADNTGSIATPTVTPPVTQPAIPPATVPAPMRPAAPSGG